MKYDLIYNCDAYTEIGVGHLFRGIDIINYFCNQTDNLHVAIRGKYDKHLIPIIKRTLNNKVDILLENNASNSNLSIIDTMFYPGKQNINHNYVKETAALSEKLIMIWDVEQIILPKEIGIYINHLPFAKVKKSNENQSAFTGLDYLPVPDRFFNTAKYNLNGNVLFVVGSTPSHNYITELFELIKKNLKGSIQLILSPSMQFEFVNELRSKFKEFDILQNVDDLVHYFNTASTIVTTYGNTSYQALASKRPVFTLGLIDFQNYYGMKLEEDGYSINLGHISDLNVDKIKMIQDKSYLKSAQAKLQEKFNQPTIGNVLKIIIENLN